MPFRQIPEDSPRGTTPGSPGPVSPPNRGLSGAERLERIEKGYRPPENYWEEDKPPIKFPFEDRDIPGPRKGMTIPPRQPLPIIPPYNPPPKAEVDDFQEKMKGLMDRLNEEDNPQDLPPEMPPWELLTPEQQKWVI